MVVFDLGWLARWKQLIVAFVLEWPSHGEEPRDAQQFAQIPRHNTAN